MYPSCARIDIELEYHRVFFFFFLNTRLVFAIYIFVVNTSRCVIYTQRKRNGVEQRALASSGVAGVFRTLINVLQSGPYRFIFPRLINCNNETSATRPPNTKIATNRESRFKADRIFEKKKKNRAREYHQLQLAVYGLIYNCVVQYSDLSRK